MEANQRSRRGFLRSALATAGAFAAVALCRTTPAAADGPEGYRDRWRFVPRPKHTPVGPTPSGIPGVSYFKAGDGHGRQLTKAGLAVFFDGRDVMKEAFEADLVGQWVGLYGPRVPGRLRARYYAHGRVELRPAGGLRA
jgi:hypothetical protein